MTEQDRPDAAFLKRLVIAWDADDMLDFMAAIVAARKHLGMKLADTEEEAADLAVLDANGYTSDGEPKPRGADDAS